MTVDEGAGAVRRARPGFRRAQDRPRCGATSGPSRSNAKATFAVSNTLRDVESRNVVARLEGSDPQLRNEYVVYTAHWDHLGRDQRCRRPDLQRRRSTTPRASPRCSRSPRVHAAARRRRGARSCSSAGTAEEKGLLGAQVLRDAPALPARADAGRHQHGRHQPLGPTRDVVVIGSASRRSTTSSRGGRGSQGRVVEPDPSPRRAIYYRSDHFEFAEAGVPALDPHAGVDYIGKPADYGQQKRDEYIANDYHKVSDEVKPDWDLSGAVEDLRLFFRRPCVAQATASRVESRREFKARRDAMLKK